MRFSKQVSIFVAVLSVWVGCLLVRSAPIGGQWSPLKLHTTVFLWAWLSALLLGLMAGLVLKGASNRSARGHDVVLASPNRLAITCSLIALFGAAAITYDFAFVRGYGFSTGVAAIRLAEVASSMDAGSRGSILSGVGRLMTPALFAAHIIAVISWARMSLHSKLIVLLATVAVIVEQYLFEGGRFYVAALLVSVIAARWLWGRGIDSTPNRAAKRETMRKTLRGVIALTITCVAFALVFVDRVKGRSLNLGDIYAAYTLTFDLQLNEDFDESWSRNLSPSRFAALMFWVYGTQGANGLERLMEVGQIEHGWGRYQFSAAAIAINRLTGLIPEYQIFDVLPEVGVYTTMAGTSYIDFGVYGAMIFAVLTGAYTAWAASLLVSRRMSATSMAAPLLVAVCLFSPANSIVGNVWPALVILYLFVPFSRKNYQVRGD